MNKLQANASLLAITLLAGIQYAFLKNVPGSVSHFAFLFITNFIGFLIGMLALGGELCRADRKQILCSAALAGLLLGFNLFMLIGAGHLDTIVTSFTITAYIVFIPAVSLLFHRRVSGNQIAGMMVVLAGLAFSMRVNLSGFLNPYVLCLIAADLFFAFYIVFAEQICAKMNPAVLLIGELFFGSLFSFAGWMVQDGVSSLALPGDPAFWGSALFVAFFIRGLYGLVQLYAQRYVSAIQVSLVFSTEIIFTLALSPVLSKLMGTAPEPMDAFKAAGCFMIICGVLAADKNVISAISAMISRGRKEGAHG